jgi:preprotein translocase subunit SecA
MIKALVEKVIGTKHDRTMKKLQPLVAAIGEWERRLEPLSDEELVAKTAEFRQRVDKGQSLDQLLPEAFATVRVASMRALGMRHFDVQLIGGMVMHQGKIAEMKTGEGKTLTATLPLYLNALSGKGAHLVTVNDYLASRDAEWMGQLYRFLGLSVGTIVRDLTTEERRAAYNSDITYGTNNELGFDYLRDNMKLRASDEVQRVLNFAIVDEVDSILIDEARTPLIISGQAEGSSELYTTIDAVVVDLRRDQHYTVDEEHRSVTLTDEGVDEVERRLGLDNLFEPTTIELVHHVSKALEAHTLYRKGEQYLIDDGKIVIVDEFTGRAMPGRRWSDGLHQAIEAKEGVQIREEQVTLATITYQNFFRMYDKLAGMTGTADTEAEEFGNIYKLDVVVIPTNRPIQRKDQPDLVYRTEREKFTAIVDQIVECNERGQPVLVGTVSVDKSEVISKVLAKRNISHSVLNAKQHGREADIVAQAGRKGSVTIATNMAGRGTDIVLGGNPDALARKVSPDAESEDYARAVAKFTEICAREKQEVLDAGGLFILGTERHDSRRIDNQLRGRAGRQGDPGESRFFLSLEDDLMKRFGADRIQGLMARLGMEDGVPIEANMVSKSIENAQKRVEGRNFDVRKHLLEYDDVMDVQRKTIYALRKEVISGDNIKEKILDCLEETLEALLDQHASAAVRAEEWDLEGLPNALKWQFDIEVEVSDLADTRHGLEKQLWEMIEQRFEEKIGELSVIADSYNENWKDQPDYEPKTTEDVFDDLGRETYLRELDRAWRDHLRAMASLRDAVRLHGYAQKDPKHTYKAEGYELFQSLKGAINSSVARMIMRIVVKKPESIDASRRTDQAAGQTGGAPRPLTIRATGPASAAAAAAATAARPSLPKIGRNDPCWCGSGKKYKQCHMRLDREHLEGKGGAPDKKDVSLV